MTQEQLISKKRNTASKLSKPFFEEIWEKVLEKMASSPKLYPSVTITWLSTDEEQLKLTCGKDVTTLTIQKSLLCDDVVLYAKDKASSKKFEKFSIRFSEHTREGLNKKTGKMQLLEREITATIKLKTLF